MKGQQKINYVNFGLIIILQMGLLIKHYWAKHFKQKIGNLVDD